eukprot:TRINITY_DN5035_c0_g1_i1.p2 TRINITY_DN5035_c0_g1~~TRINITY_DN5035_c0_g1_i1.p2  ORF type:complete len:165 (+),score=22.49 TRINITY_DN5035_c0_g1_i1:70-564(+)
MRDTRDLASYQNTSQYTTPIRKMIGQTASIRGARATVTPARAVAPRAQNRKAALLASLVIGASVAVSPSFAFGSFEEAKSELEGAKNEAGRVVDKGANKLDSAASDAQSAGKSALNDADSAVNSAAKDVKSKLNQESTQRQNMIGILVGSVMKKEAQAIFQYAK